MAMALPGLGGPWALRAWWLGQVGKNKIFLKYFLVQKQIQGIPKNAYKARKILRKSQTFQENSQR
jgi:hypothetical protein